MLIADGATFDFEREISPHLGALQHLARRLTRNREDAEDLVQSTLERAYRHRGRYRPGTNLRGWLATILTRLAIDGRRRAARAPDAASLDEAERACERGAARAGVGATPVETHALDRLAAAEILDSLTVLRPHVRVVMQATAAQFSTVEIARSLGIPNATVKTRLRRGRQRLREIACGAPDQPHKVGSPG